MTRRRDIWAVVPIKEFSGAKSRLAPQYDTTFRRGLARAMARDVLTALSRVPELAGIAIVTSDPETMLLARRFGAAVFQDGAQDGHTGAVTAAVRRLVREGRRGMLTVPGDIPGITAAEIGQLIAAHPDGIAFSIVPAHDLRGSNAILINSAAVPLAFGDDSFFPHLAAARARGLEPTILELPGIAYDIDNAGDLAMLLRRPPADTHTWSFLAEARLVAPPGVAAPAATRSVPKETSV